MNRAAPVLLAGFAIVLAVVIALEIGAGFGNGEPAPPIATRFAAPAAGAANSTTSRSETASWTATALARPLFNPERRPVQEATTSAVLVTETPRLTGVMVGPFGKRAIFATDDDGKPMVVDEGGMVGGYVVQAIEDGTVTVNGPDGPQTLRPSFTNAPPPLPAPGTASPVVPFPPAQTPGGAVPARSPRPPR